MTLPAAASANSVIPRPEHPRPDFMRAPWINLNGRWRFTFDKENEGEQRRWHRLSHPESATGIANGYPHELSGDPFSREIVVPFPWESPLSEIEEPDYKGAAWYQRVVTVPEDWANEADTAATTATTTRTWKRKPYLCFGAVDWHARVWVNGRFAGEHAGGYAPFAVDISKYVTPGKAATICVRAWDVCDADTCLGKQTYDWYTHSGGIWQTVWLEGRAPIYIEQIHVTPDLDGGQATFAVTVAAADKNVAGKRHTLRVTSADGAFPEVAHAVTPGDESAIVTFDVAVPNAKAWSPEEPNLYDCTVTLAPDGGDALPDAVTTYFGLRKISRGFWDDKPYEYVFLNDEPVYLRGALDQAFTPGGLHTYPTDEAIRADVQLAKDVGLNMLRCHIKINEPRYYFWADKLGVLVMYDIPSTGAYNPTARKNWEQAFRDALARDYSHPSIFSWILFNETWGLEEHQTAPSWNWVAEMFDLAKSLDPTRLIEDNSACLYDHVKTDLNTWHHYIADYDRARRFVARLSDQVHEGSSFNYVSRFQHLSDAAGFKQGTEPFLNSEYAGLGAGGGDKDVSYSFKFLTGDLRRHDKVCGYVYTELTDLEWEHNGYVNYDRTQKEWGYDTFVPGMALADLNGADFVGVDCAPCQTLAPGEILRASAFVSHWDRKTFEGGNARLRWQVSFVDRFGSKTPPGGGGQRDLSNLRRYHVNDAGEIAVTLPAEPGLFTLALFLEDTDGTIRARNYVNVDVTDGKPLPATEITSTGGHVLRFSPGDYTESSWPQPTLAKQGAKFGGGGAGYVEYELTLPTDLDLAHVTGLRVVFEAGARTAQARLGWRRINHTGYGGYPQTEEKKLPTDVVVSVNGTQIGQIIRLPDDPADARGVLSLHLQENFEFGSYGFLTTVAADAETAKKALAAAPNGRLTVRFEVPRTTGAKANGLNLYGERMGAFPVAPTLFVDGE